MWIMKWFLKWPHISKVGRKLNSYVQRLIALIILTCIGLWYSWWMVEWMVMGKKIVSMEAFVYAVEKGLWDCYVEYYCCYDALFVPQWNCSKGGKHIQHQRCHNSLKQNKIIPDSQKMGRKKKHPLINYESRNNKNMFLFVEKKAKRILDQPRMKKKRTLRRNYQCHSLSICLKSTPFLTIRRFRVRKSMLL